MATYKAQTIPHLDNAPILFAVFFGEIAVIFISLGIVV
jgi:hypothetical protein